MNEITMNYKFRVVPKDGSDITYASCGGFCFNIRHPKTGELIALRFDFDAAGVRNTEGFDCEYESGRGPMFNELHISKDFEDEYEELGLTVDDITAELLSKAESIEEMFVMIDTKEGGEEAPYSEYVVEEIVLSDGENDYEVSKEVITAFNEKTKSELTS